jgi:hypothetical protein
MTLLKKQYGRLLRHGCAGTAEEPCSGRKDDDGLLAGSQYRLGLRCAKFSAWALVGRSIR